MIDVEIIETATSSVSALGRSWFLHYGSEFDTCKDSVVHESFFFDSELMIDPLLAPTRKSTDHLFIKKTQKSGHASTHRLVQSGRTRVNTFESENGTSPRLPVIG